jgi:RNA polymerase sigma-70 factor (ECF subfamily)
MQLGRNADARIAFDRAIALARTPAEAAHIRLQIERLLRAPADPPTAANADQS